MTLCFSIRFFFDAYCEFKHGVRLLSLLRVFQYASLLTLTTKEQAEPCDYVGTVSGDKVPDKLEKCGFTVTKSDKVNAPVIDQLPVAIECKVIEIQEELGETRVVAEIVGMKADESVLTDGKVDISKLHPIMFDTVAKCYREIGENIGGAWSIGKKFI